MSTTHPISRHERLFAHIEQSARSLADRDCAITTGTVLEEVTKPSDGKPWTPQAIAELRDLLTPERIDALTQRFSRKRESAPPPVPLAITPARIEEAAGVKPPSLGEALLSAPDLLRLDIPERPRILGEWFREGDLGYLFAPRGHGKTWMAMMIANAVTHGAPLGEWAAGPAARRLIYFDAEMNLPDVQQRAREMEINSERFLWLQHERIFERFERSLNVMDKGDQEMIATLLDEGDVLVIDNLSTGSSGIEENNNDHFDAIKSWLLRLRNRHISVLIIHHAGKNGVMRGASRKEDMAHWILSLKDDSGDGDTKAFITTFVKCRNCEPLHVPPLRWTIQTSGGRFTYRSVRHSGPDALLALIRSGIESNRDLASELGVSNGQVSKWFKRLQALCPPVVEKKGNRYLPVEIPDRPEID
jgi:hypothetical protein